MTPASLTRRNAVHVLVVFTLAAVIRLTLDTGPGYEGDVGAYGAQTWKIVHFGISSAYVRVEDVSPSDNPPVLLYPFWLVGSLYQQLISSSLSPTWLKDPVTLRFMLRLPSLIADLLAGGLIFQVLRRKELSFKHSLVATSAYLFNPAMIFDSAYWGQMAAIHTLSMLLTIIAVDRSAYHWTGAALATAILTKPQALAIAPVVVMLAAREGGFVRFSGAGLLMTAVITAPFLVAGQIGRVVQQYLHITEFDPVLAANAHNFWWLVSGGHGWQPDAAGFGPVSFRGVGLLLFAGATLLSALLVWRERRMVYLAASYQSLAFYMLNTEIHENHSLAMFAPLAIAAALDRRVWWLYGAFAFTALANMALHDPALLTWAGYPDIKEGAALAMPRWLNALAQILLFGAFTWKLIRHLRLGEPNDTERSIN